MLHLGNSPGFAWERRDPEISKNFGFMDLHSHKAVALGHKIYIIGGKHDLYRVADADATKGWLPVLDVVKCVWKFIPIPLEAYRQVEHLAFAQDDKIHFFGGNGQATTHEHWCFDVVQRGCFPKRVYGENPFPRAGAAHALVEKINVFVMFGGKGPDGNLSNDVFCLDVDSMEWYKPSVAGRKPSSRKGACACVVNKVVYIYGGCGNDRNTRFGELYGLAESFGAWRWTCLYDPSDGRVLPRSSCAIAAINGRVFIYGGRVHGEAQDTLYFYSVADRYLHDVGDGKNPENAKFCYHGYPPKRLMNHQMVRVGSWLIVTGGENLHPSYMTLQPDVGYVGETYSIRPGDLKEIFPKRSPYTVVPEVAKAREQSAVKLMVKALLEVDITRKVESGTGFLVVRTWMTNLRRFLFSESVDDHPGPVYNSALFEPHMFYELQSLPECDCVSSQGWEVLMKLFGGGPGLKRSIKKYRPVRTVSLRVVCTDNLKAFRRAFFEDSQYLTEVHTTLCTMFNVDPQVTRMYDYTCNKPYARLDNRPGQLLASTLLIHDNLILLELPATEDGKYTVILKKPYIQEAILEDADFEEI